MKKRSGHSGSSSETATTAETLSPSAASTTTTTTYSDMSTSQTHRSSKSPIKVAIKAVFGAFVTCFTPPEDDDHDSYVKKQGGRKQQKVPSASSRTAIGGKKKHEVARSYNSTLEAEAGKVKFTLAQIYKATKNFSPSLKIGQGGFGTVYKGTLEDGALVAVKRAKRSDYGENLVSEFASEIKMLGQVQHLNLVKFYGFLVADDERIIVVEYVPNGTLREHLDYIHGIVLDMAARLDIAIDVAHAITYLHMYTENPIIHRDIKSSNILLTERYRAKVADFGFARLGADRESTDTHVFTQVKGTAGYLDPEYLKTNELTVKSDVYSFGILLVELVTGRRPLDTKRVSKERFTAKWVIAKFTEGDAVSTMDPRLEVTTANSITLEKVLELAFTCLAPERQDRPTMKQCAEVLWSIRKEYKEVSASDASDFGSLSSNSKRSQSVQEE